MPTNAASRAVELLIYVVREGSALSCEGYSYVWPELVGDQGILSMGCRINYLLPFHDGSAKTKMFMFVLNFVLSPPSCIVSTTSS